MSLPENQDPLDALLREQHQYVADDGFTQRVMASLPARRARRSPQYFLLGAAIVGWIVAVLWLPWRNLPPLNVVSSDSLEAQIWPWAVVLCVAASVIWAAIAALQWED
jgi:hypothetical protein